jgi:hypothetical protein
MEFKCFYAAIVTAAGALSSHLFNCHLPNFSATLSHRLNQIRLAI